MQHWKAKWLPFTTNSTGLLVDAMQGDFAEASREHFLNHNVAMMRALYTLFERSIEAGEGQKFGGIIRDRDFPGDHRGWYRDEVCERSRYGLLVIARLVAEDE